EQLGPDAVGGGAGEGGVVRRRHPLRQRPPRAVCRCGAVEEAGRDRAPVGQEYLSAQPAGGERADEVRPGRGLLGDVDEEGRGLAELLLRAGGGGVVVALGALDFVAQERGGGGAGDGLGLHLVGLVERQRPRLGRVGALGEVVRQRRRQQFAHDPVIGNIVL